MTTITSARGPIVRTATTERKAKAMFARIFTLLAAAGRAVPFHRESNWQLAGSTNFLDRDHDRMALELRAISGHREHC
ncbi:hypothetical protein AB0N05_32170 [Nocardia sp. NPDC051030]|uniref:hypothetical protein n=1 Tax=Nocardia sp. NPDC051030 TaxID=3155162 RepID=UPI003440383E